MCRVVPSFVPARQARAARSRLVQLGVTVRGVGACLASCSARADPHSALIRRGVPAAREPERMRRRRRKDLPEAFWILDLRRGRDMAQ